MINRTIVVVIDGFGVGELPDANQYGDCGSNTLEGIYRNTKLELPNMQKMGLYNMDGIQRLAEMIKGRKDKSLIKIVNYLMTQTQMEKDFLKKEKDLKKMMEYIRKLAKKVAINGVAMIDDETVYKWAKEFFIKSNEELGFKKYNVTKAKHGDIIKTEVNDEFGSIFDIEEIPIEKGKKEIEQISLF